jgi:hypothetical protein
MSNDHRGTQRHSLGDEGAREEFREECELRWGLLVSFAAAFGVAEIVHACTHEHVGDEVPTHSHEHDGVDAPDGRDDD